MKIYESAVRKPISTCLLFLGVIIFGLFSLKNLAIDQYPEMDPPYITVATVYAGANAADIETNITRVLEDQLNSVDNLKEITSTSKDNVSMITLEMEWGSDLDVAMNDVRDIVSRTQTLLPDEVDYPTIFKFSSSMMPVMLLSVTADESYYAMDKILDDRLVNVLNRVNGIGSVSVIGQPVREIQVNVDPEKIEAFGLTIESIGGIIASENLNVPAGSMDLASGTYNVKADGEFTDSEQLKHLVVSTRGGRTVKLSDVAEVKDTIQKITMDTRANGRRSAMIMIQKQSGANTVEIVEDIQKRLLDATGKHMEVMVYGDGAFKDPVGKIWELADPVVSPAYTAGLEGTPNELKLKYLADNTFANLSGEALRDAIKEKIQQKDGSSLVGNMASQGTTPRRLTDLIGSLCDLTSGSGDKGTPIVYIQGYFDNFTTD